MNIALQLTGSGNYELVSLASKPEFQLEYGAGAVTLGDLTRQWAKLLIQPDTRLTRGKSQYLISTMLSDLRVESQFVLQLGI